MQRKHPLGIKRLFLGGFDEVFSGEETNCQLKLRRPSWLGLVYCVVMSSFELEPLITVSPRFGLRVREEVISAEENHGKEDDVLSLDGEGPDPA
jgi:hypothetical protein